MVDPSDLSRLIVVYWFSFFILLTVDVLFCQPWNYNMLLVMLALMGLVFLFEDY